MTAGKLDKLDAQPSFCWQSHSRVGKPRTWLAVPAKGPQEQEHDNADD